MNISLVPQKIAKTNHPVLPQIAERYSPRVFDDQRVPDEKLNTLFEAARWAASSFNQQPWRFVYGHRGTDAYNTLLDLLVPFNSQWAKNAPLLVMTVIKEQFDNGKDNYHALHDLGLAIGNLSIQAQEEGLAVHQMAGFDWQKAHEVYSIPEGYHAVSMLAIGFYGGNPDVLPEDLRANEETPRQRKLLNELVGEGAFPG